MTAGVWQDANTVLDQIDINIIVSSLISGGWKPANAILGTVDFNVNIIVPQDGSWKKANVPLRQANINLNIIQHPVPPIPPVPLPGKIFAGRINSVIPTQFKVGDPLRFAVAFEVVTNSLVEQINGWVITLALKLDTMSQTINSTTILGSNDNKVSVFNFDLKKPMPNKILKGTVILTAYKGTFLGIGSSYSEVLEIKSITVTLPGIIPPKDGEKTDLTKALPWIALGIGAVMFMQPKKSRSRKR